MKYSIALKSFGGWLASFIFLSVAFAGCSLFLEDVGGEGEPCAEDNNACLGDLVCDLETMLCMSSSLLDGDDGDSTTDDDDDDDSTDGDATDDDDDDDDDDSTDGDTTDDDDDDDDDSTDGDDETCANACEAGETRCVSDTTRQVCDLVQGGCLTWNTAVPCEAGLRCQQPDEGEGGNCLPVAVEPGNLRITEFMVSTGFGTDDQQWVEIYNRTDLDLDLRGLTIGNGVQDHTFTEGRLKPHAYGVISRFDPPSAGLQNVVLKGFSFLLTKTGGTLVLKKDTATLDRLTYTAPWVEQGVSTQLGRESLNEVDVSDRALWCFRYDDVYSGTLMGTPGRENRNCDEEMCDDECTGGDTRCVSQIEFQACRIQEDNCYDWGASETCISATPLCNEQNGQCVACESNCPQVGKHQCVDIWRAQNCTGITSGCLLWGEPADCGSGYHCEDGACVAGCVHECTHVGARRCAVDGSSYQECVDDGGNCRYWGSPISCGNDFGCEQGFCLTESCDDGGSCPPGYTCEMTAEPCKPLLPEPGEVIISEFMAKPSSANEPIEEEWIELYNRSARTLSLSGLTISNLTRTATLPEGVVLAPGSYVTLTAAVMPPQGIVNIAMNGYDFELNDIAGTIVLKKGNGEISRINYVASWLTEGKSNQLSRDRLGEVDYGNVTNWCLGNSGYNADNMGTPGGPNAACSTNLCNDECTPSGKRTCATGESLASYKVCDSDGEEGCLVWTDPVPCNSPPSDYCLNGSTLYRMDGSSTCEEGLCHYAGTSVNCPGGCSNGVCN